MRKSAYVRARVEPELKMAAESILSELGITPTQALSMLYKRVAREHGWPLELKLPNKETRDVFEKTDLGVDVVKCKNLDELFDKIGI